MDTDSEPYEKWSSTPVKNELKFDDKGGSDYMPINYEPQPTEISFVQCFRLPAPLNNTDMEVSHFFYFVKCLFINRKLAMRAW
ncbi:unnamed protein product [Gongylonema pulchrum]|uniref:Uncharacterized protein n=1 Tax=Gongylonema pulchrum TaxID=637853 RepID=A0A183DL83_9BILA|nr:unnamed protein product [Gongylonema pulchrum]